MTTPTRTPFLKPEEMNPQQRAVYDDILRSRGTWLNGPYAPLLHSPELAAKAQVFGEHVRYHTSLAPRLSELAILVTARHWDCNFEWVQHAPIAVRQGVAQEVCDAIAQNIRPTLSDAQEAVVYEFSAQILALHRVEDSTYEHARALLGVQGVVDLVAVIGYYSFIAMTLNAHEVPLPGGVVAPLPPRLASH